MSKSLSEHLESDEPDNVPDRKLIHNNLEVCVNKNGDFDRFWGIALRVKHPVIPKRWYVLLPGLEWVEWDENEKCFSEMPMFITTTKECMQALFDSLYARGVTTN